MFTTMITTTSNTTINSTDRHEAKSVAGRAFNFNPGVVSVVVTDETGVVIFEMVKDPATGKVTKRFIAE